MRGLKAEDLIFAGTAQRPRVGIAQATIVFDNQSRFFPTDYEEVSIRRRIERDGTSQYFLNDAEVRLKDVIDFFAQSRLGTKGFSIINQGDSDLFVRSSPKERRAMLEEILGLRQFQLKKHDAELKLASTKFNMEKVEALIEEILPHLKLLRRQTSKWEKHDSLATELKAFEETYFSAKLHDIAEEEKRIAPERAAIEEKLATARKTLQELDLALKNVEREAPANNKQFDAWQKEKQSLLGRKSAIEKELGKIEARIEMAVAHNTARFTGDELVKLLEEARERIEDILYEANVKVIKDLLQKLFDKLNGVLDHESDAPDRSADTGFDAEKEKLTKELDGIQAKFQEIAELEKKVTEGLKGFNESFKAAFEAVRKKEEEVNRLESEKAKIAFAEERLKIRRADLHDEAARIGRSISDFKSASHTSLDLFDLERKMLKLRGEIAAIGDVDPALVKEAEETETRYAFLASQLEDLEKAHKDLVVLVKELDRKIHDDFASAIKSINDEFGTYFKMMFGGGHAKLSLQKIEVKKEETATNASDGASAKAAEGDNSEEQKEEHGGIDINISIPRKRITGLDMLSGGEKTLVSIAVLFALIAVSPPPFLVLDEADAALDESNTRRFANLIKQFSEKTQFVVVTHNRATMEAADILYGITMGEDGTSKVLSLKLE
jgi:chromosome segregation protein